MTDLILAAADGYDIQQLKPFVLSLKETGYNGCLCVVTYRIEKETLEWLANEGVVTYEIEYNTALGNMFAHVVRFWHFHQFLSRVEEEFKHVMCFDISDVIFQCNPSEYLQQRLGDKKIIAPSEGIKFADEEWANNLFPKCFGEEAYILSGMNNNICRNVGTIAGTFEFMKSFCLTLFQISKGSMTYPSDQTGANLLFYGVLKDITKFTNHGIDSWAANLGTTADSTKAHLWPKNCEQRPIITGDNKVITVNNKEYSVVHQWPRVPQLKEYITKKYV